MKKTVSIYDARGNGNGEVPPTLTGDHQNRVTDYTAIVVESFAVKGFGEYGKSEISATLRASGAEVHGGGEVLIVEHCVVDDNTTKINGGHMLYDMCKSTCPSSCD